MPRKLLQGKAVAVSIPDTVLEEKESPREKTAKLGTIARACAIYGVDVIEVFRDPTGRGEGPEIKRVLEYLETPQYLRKRLYPLDETLRYAGVLPPLRIPSHRPKIPTDKIPLGQVREGVVDGDGTVDVGLDVHPRLSGSAPKGSRVTVRFSSLKPPEAEIVPREKVNEYWGYRVESRSNQEILSDSRFGIKIATSKMGTPLADSLRPLEASVKKSSSVKMIFGSPARGLFEMLGKDLAKRVDFVVNLFPEQQVQTVRTEEALFVGLGVLSLVSAEKA